VISYNTLLRDLLPVTFLPLPGGQDMRVSWRQAIRTGKNDGKLIEDDGVFVDYYVPQTREDLEKPPHDIEGYNTQSQYKKISSRLEKIGIADGRRFLNLKIIQRHESGN
jgi:hypothetical protein